MGLVWQAQSLPTQLLRQGHQQSALYSFHQMYTPAALRFAQPFLRHEEAVLTKIIAEQKNKLRNVVVIGAGPLAYADLVRSEPSLHYLGVDPCYQHTHHADSLVHLLPVPFEQLTRTDWPAGPTIFIFWFNVMFYLAEGVEHLNSLLQGGDLVLFSTWSRSNAAQRVLQNYYREVYKQINADCSQIVARIVESRKSIVSALELPVYCERYSNDVNLVEVVYTW